MRHLFLLLSIHFMLISSSYAQNDQHRLVLMGDSLYKYMNYQRALHFYTKATNKFEEDVSLKFKLAQTHIKLQNLDEALAIYTNLTPYDSLWTTEQRMLFAQLLHENGEHQRAERYLDQWIGEMPDASADVLNGFQNSEKYFEDSAVYTVKSAWFNTKEREFGPAFYKEGLIFISSRADQNNSKQKYHWDGGNFFDIYQVDSLTGGGKARAMNKGLNSRLHEGPGVFTDEFSKIIFTRNVTKGDKNYLGIFTAEVDEEGKWATAYPLNLNQPGYSVGHPAINRTGDTLLFVSDKPGGYGGTDLYYSVKVEQGWSEPVNLGSTVNGASDEMFPFWSNHNEIFFSSKSHAGMGGLDIFTIDGTLSDVKNIRNIGWPLNSYRDDMSFIVDVDRRMGFLASNRNGNDDIFQFMFDKTIIDVITLYDGEPLPEVNITIGDETLISDSQGRLHLKLPSGSDYQMQASKEGFKTLQQSFSTGSRLFLSLILPLSPDSTGNVPLPDVLTGEEKILAQLLFVGSEDFAIQRYLKTERDVYKIEEVDSLFVLSSISDTISIPKKRDDRTWGLTKTLENDRFKITNKVSLNNIYFDFDRADIRPDAEESLSLLVDFLSSNPDMVIYLSAHTDARGTNRYNLKLSEKRATSVKEYLIQKGILSDQIKSRGFGERLLTVPCRINCNEEQHQLNRRASFSLESFRDNQKVYGSEKKLPKRASYTDEGFSKYEKFMSSHGDIALPGLEFKIALGAYRYNDQLTFGDLSNLGALKKRQHNGITYYYLTSYGTLRECEEALKQVRNKGYEDAYATYFYQDERLTFAHLKELLVSRQP